MTTHPLFVHSTVDTAGEVITDTLWVCIDCHMIESNGWDDPAESDFTPDREPWNLLDDSRLRITPGLMAELHDITCDCVDLVVTQDDGSRTVLDPAWKELDVGQWTTREFSHNACTTGCEERSFSWDRCEGCGSTLGGSRHAYTHHLKDNA